MRRILLSAVAVVMLPLQSAGAVGFMTQLSCASDYYAYCSKHAVGSKELRSCMNANGHKLSKSCINALISDGEITKEEVVRRRDEMLAAKKPAKTETVQAAKVEQAAKLEPSKSKLARLPDVKSPSVTPEPMRVLAGITLTLDQQTYEALKNRGDRFVFDAADVVPNSSVPALPALAASEASRPATVAVTAAPAIAATIPSVAAEEALAETTEMSVRPTEYPPGKMALGKKPSLEQPSPPVQVEVVEPPKPSSAETWLNYMKHRFEGGMNYQGVDANF